MKLAIFGKHPVPQGGFDGVMSLFEAIGFSRLGYDVSLLIAFPDSAAYDAVLARLGIEDLNALPKFGGRFDIVPVYPDGRGFQEVDVLIYQSCRPEDWDTYGALCQDHAGLLTKNFPKFVPDHDFERETSVIGQFANFDLIACALRSDLDIFRANPAFWHEHGHRLAHVPRGADPALLHAGYKTATAPIIGLDMPSGDDARAYMAYVGPIKRLRRDYPGLKVLTIGKTIPELESTAIPYGRFDRLYDRFFNLIWVYCTIDYRFSPAHLQAEIHKRDSGWGPRAVFEVQNIEAQMSGAPILGRRACMIDELYEPGVTGFNYRDQGSETQIYRTLSRIIADMAHYRTETRKWALRHFTWESCIARWHDAIQACRRTTGQLR